MTEQHIEVLLEEMLEKQTEVFPEEMLEQQLEVLLEEEEETQGFYEFHVCFMITSTDGRNKGCLVQEKKRDDDSDQKFKYQSRELLKSENEEIVMDDNQEEFYCSRE